VNLRGIGSNRNVVLLDGDRIVPAGFGGQVDLNNIPLALVERVDVLTGGASTTYGADAVGGVVNFILKNDFSGLEAQASQQLTEKGDGNVFRADVTIGANFDDGRGNAVFGIGYQQADAVYQGARDVSLTTLDTYSGTALGSGTSDPSRFSGSRLVSGTGNGGTNQINAAGQLVPTFQTFNFNPYNVFQTPFERYNMFGQARYEVSDAVEVYSRGLFSKNTVNTIIAPSGAFSIAVNIPLNNPFLPAAARNQFCAFDVNPSASVYTPRFTQAQCDAAAVSTLRPGQAGYLEIGTGGASATATTSGTVLQYCKHGSHSTLTAMARFQQVKVTTLTRSHFLPVALLKLAHVFPNMSRPYSITAWVPVVRSLTQSTGISQVPMAKVKTFRRLRVIP